VLWVSILEVTGSNFELGRENINSNVSFFSVLAVELYDSTLTSNEPKLLFPQYLFTQQPSKSQHPDDGHSVVLRQQWFICAS
jgi:hypothetical protein